MTEVSKPANLIKYQYNTGAIRLWLWLILIFSAALRLALIFKGGQQFWPDESRYVESRIAVNKIVAGHSYEAWQGLLGAPEHILFKIVGLIPAWSELLSGESQYSPAIFFSIFSVANLWLVWKFSKITKATDNEALIAIYLSAGANCLFYFSRHYLPYDLSLCLGLVGACFALQKTTWSGFIAGVMAALCFLAYNGSGILSACILLGSTVTQCRQGVRTLILRVTSTTLGFLIPLAILVLSGFYLGQNVIKTLRSFSNTITQGDLGYAFITVPQYFFATEGINALIIGTGTVCGIYLLLTRKIRITLAWAASTIVILSSVLIATSDVFNKFAVYGRIARVIWPFACICTAGVISRAWIENRNWRWCCGLTLGIYGVQVYLNFRTPINQWFPKEFSTYAAVIIEENQRLGIKNLNIIHTSFYFSPQNITKEPLPIETVWSEKHPQQWEPYLFEGFTRDERTEVLSSPAEMSVVRLGSRNNVGWHGADPELSKLDGFPGRVKLTVRFPTDRLGTAEPLIVTGHSGNGDSVYVIYQDSAHIRIGFDHWGIGGLVSPDILINFNEIHSLIVAMGSLYPASSTKDKSEQLYIELNGQVLWNIRQEFHPSSSGSIAFGVNLIGGGTSSAIFNGKIEQVSPYP
jgi:hypothetical protein